MAQKDFQCFSCLTVVAFILALCTISLNILGYQYAESQDPATYPNDRVYVIYHHDSVYVEYTATTPVTKIQVSRSETYDYQEVKEYFEPRCGGVVDQALCDGLDGLTNGGKSWLGLNSTAIFLLFLACVTQCVFLVAPNALPKCSHWVLSGSCLIAAILFWAAFGAWQSVFTNNKATDAILDYVFVQVILINPVEHWSYLDATMGASTILLLICSIICLIAMFMSFRFSYDRHQRGNYADMESNLPSSAMAVAAPRGPVARV